MNRTQLAADQIRQSSPLESESMNTHDQQRQNQLVKSLLKAKEQAGTVVLYLTVNNRNMDDSFNARLALEHIEIALEHLGVTGET